MKPLYKALLCGDRNWGDWDKIENTIIALRLEAVAQGKELVIISGGAPGADTIARLAANKQNVHCAEVNALWATRHRGAGPQRNSVMLGLGPDVCFAFHRNIAKSVGTKNMLAQCRSAGVLTRVIR